MLELLSLLKAGKKKSLGEAGSSDVSTKIQTSD